MCIPDSLAGHIKPLKREELECGKHCPLSPCVFEICGEIVKVKKLDDLARSGIVVLRQTLLRYGFAVTWGKSKYASGEPRRTRIPHLSHFHVVLPKIIVDAEFDV